VLLATLPDTIYEVLHASERAVTLICIALIPTDPKTDAVMALRCAGDEPAGRSARAMWS